MDTKNEAPPHLPLVWLSLTLIAFVVFIGVLLRRRRWPPKRRSGERQLAPLEAPALARFQGLSETEARERRTLDPAQKQLEEAHQVRRDIWLKNTVSIFNISMLGLATIQWLLDDRWGALLTLSILALSIGLNVFQQLFAVKRVGQLKELTRPLATVVRDGQVKSVIPDELVIGDAVVVGSGDRFLADGEVLHSSNVLVQETAYSGASQPKTKHIGDKVRVGSTCVQGRVVYRVTALPSPSPARLPIRIFKTDNTLTPLQYIIDRILRVMLLFIGLFLVLLILDMASFPLMSPGLKELYREIASIIFSLAPSGLFFMIVVTYAMGSATLGRTGALVRDALAVESLAQVTTLCFGKTDALTGAEVQIELVPAPMGHPGLAESRIRQILGDLAHSVPPANWYLRALADSLEGEQRVFEQSSRLLSIYGWSGFTLADADASGTYVIGEPEILQPYLVSQAEADETDHEEPMWQTGLRNVGHFFRIGNKQEAEGKEYPASIRTVETAATAVPATEKAVSTADFFGQLRARFARFVHRSEPEQNDDPPRQPSALPEIRLMFAYLPEPRSLFDATGQPSLPQGLIPLCNLVFSEQIRSEAIETVTTFIEEGVKIKILSSDPPDRVRTIARQLGLGGDENTPLTVLSGAELTQMSPAQLVDVVQETTLFAALTQEQKGQMVRSLRERGEHVAMVGDSVGDLPAMEAAQLSITSRGSIQAALSQADIILLKGTPEVLPTVLQLGQRIVNGLLDILKLNLTQIIYLLLLIVVMVLSGSRIFFYHPTQGGVIVFFTLIAPAIGLTLWATKGAVPRKRIGQQLIRFVVPAALTIAVVVILLTVVFFQATQSVPYPQLVVTFALVAMGLALVVFVQPPIRALIGGDVLCGDWRPTYLSIGLLILFNIIVFVPLAQSLLRIAPLFSITDYVIIGVVTVFWGVALLGIWRTRWLQYGVDILAKFLITRRAIR